MFAATGNHVDTLQRTAVGDLSLEGLSAGAWRQLASSEIALIFGSQPADR
jgi:16S rRNA pseudouridine516 synthase